MEMKIINLRDNDIEYTYVFIDLQNKVHFLKPKEYDNKKLNPGITNLYDCNNNFSYSGCDNQYLYIATIY
jgi:hypothetical protein